MHQLEGGGMNGIAAEVAVEIGVLFEHGDLAAGACQQIAGHHPGRATAHNDAAVMFHHSGHRAKRSFTGSRRNIDFSAQRLVMASLLFAPGDWSRSTRESAKLNR